MDPAADPVVVRRRRSNGWGLERGVSPLPPSCGAAVMEESCAHSEDLEGSPLLQRDVGEQWSLNIVVSRNLSAPLVRDSLIPRPYSRDSHSQTTFISIPFHYHYEWNDYMEWRKSLICFKIHDVVCVALQSVFGNSWPYDWQLLKID